MFVGKLISVLSPFASWGLFSTALLALLLPLLLLLLLLLLLSLLPEALLLSALIKTCCSKYVG
jgi:hypothetical protein